MNRILISFILCISALAAFGQSYSTLKIYRGGGNSKDSIKVKVYNQEVFNIAPNQVVIFKVYTEGSFVVTANTGKENFSAGMYGLNGINNKWLLRFAHGETIYMVASYSTSGGLLNEVKEAAFERKASGSNVEIISLEEDEDKPFRRND